MTDDLTQELLETPRPAPPPPAEPVSGWKCNKCGDTIPGSRPKLDLELRKAHNHFTKFHFTLCRGCSMGLSQYVKAWVSDDSADYGRIASLLIRMTDAYEKSQGRIFDPAGDTLISQARDLIRQQGGD